MQGFNINQVAEPPTTVPGQIVPPTGGGGWGANCQPGIDGSTPDADMFNDLIGNVLRVCQVGGVAPTPNRYDDLVQAIGAIIGNASPSKLGAFGYQKMPGGFILQWGAAASNSSGVATLVLPIAFPNNLFVGLANYLINGPGIGSTVANISNLSTRTAVVAVASNAANDTPVNGANVWFIALGN
jgi:hypothetical protein